MIGRWIARLDQNHFKTIHRPRTQHRNADVLSKRTNHYVHLERILKKLPKVKKDSISCPKRTMKNSPWRHTYKYGRLIPGHPELPPEARAQLPLLYILRKESKHRPVDEQAGDIPWYPQIQWETTPTVDETDRPSHILSITTKVPPARINTTEPYPYPW